MLATWRAYAASAGETVAELVAAWDGWQPRELDLGGGYAAPRDPNTWVHGGDIAERRTPAIEDGRRCARERAASRPRRPRPAGRRGARDRAGPLVARRHRHPPHARRQPQAAARAARLALGRDGHDRDVPARPARRALPLPRRRGHAHGRAAGSSPSTSSAARAASTSLAPPGAPARRRARRHARVPRHGRLRGCVRGQLQCAAAAGGRARERRSGAEIVRRAETIEDVFARDVIPERLRP